MELDPVFSGYLFKRRDFILVTLPLFAKNVVPQGETGNHLVRIDASM